jgi:acetylornithine deacetylase/succinyl-diaminopimelate desuccinylase-like protein
MTFNFKELFDYLSIPSVSTMGETHETGCQTACIWLKNKLSNIGFSAHVTGTKRGSAVYAERIVNDSAFTLLIYSHTDVQPVDPLEEWRSDPFVPEIRKGRIYARGVSDSKGHLYAFIKGVEEYLKENSELPFNMKFLIDSDEESEALIAPEILKIYKDFFEDVDAVFIAAGAMVAKDTPSICCGYRGLMSATVKIKTSRQNLHSGTFGGKVSNSAKELAWVLSKYNEHFFKRIYSAIDGEPSFDINGFWSGTSKDNFHYIIPAEAMANISERLVVGMNPDDEFYFFEKFIYEHLPHCSCDVILVDKAFPSTVSSDTDFYRTIEKTLKKLFKKDVVKYHEGGAVPIVYEFKKLVGDNVYMCGFGSVDDNIHAPNESLRVKDFLKNIKFVKELIKELGK